MGNDPMPHYFVKDPRGRYHVWSTIVDSFLFVGGTEDEAINYELNSEFYSSYPGGKAALRYDLKCEIDNINRTGRAYEWAHTWEESINILLWCHGLEHKTVKRFIEEELIMRKHLQKCGGFAREEIDAVFPPADRESASTRASLLEL
jgi:hypothetical protein